ncbi:hypothetical protein SDC9_178062 [bioreactor metagenome]|uniref:Uncharacterized protein n=1 Tax=bioreactor metagenome TaxID=1076179 RepID=A0A645GUP8_9ZZZZ
MVHVVVHCKLFVGRAVAVGKDQCNALVFCLLDELGDGVVVDVVEHQIVNALRVKVVHVARLGGNIVLAVGVDHLDGAVGGGRVVQGLAGIGDKGITKVVPAHTGNRLCHGGRCRGGSRARRSGRCAAAAAAGGKAEYHCEGQQKRHCFFHCFFPP